MAFKRLAALFVRYAAVHLRLVGQPMPLVGVNGHTHGHIDRICLRGQRLMLEGWADSDHLDISFAGQPIIQTARMPRRDVAEAVPSLGTQLPGFLADLPHSDGPVCLTLQHGNDRSSYYIPLPNRRDIRIGRAKLLLPFLRDVARALPTIVLCIAGKKSAPRASLKRQLGLIVQPPLTKMQPLLFLDDSLAKLPASQQPAELARLQPLALAHRAITVILPIYNAMDLLPEALQRLVDHTDLPWRLILIEDASPDPTIRPFLRSWVAAQKSPFPDRITLLEHMENQGFIRSVNAGLDLAIAFGDHVVLLNSDAFLPKAWATRLLRPFLTHDCVASVTPMSNEAEIFTAPVMCKPVALLPGEGDAIDRVAAQIHPDAGLADAPTGVGFCMAMSIDYLRRVPRLDIRFGRGYGEEVDWCQKVRALGGRHLGLASLFVEHRGGASFGSVDKQRLIARNNAVITRRYPHYDSDVQGFIVNDPLNASRLALAIAWAAAHSKGAIPIYLAHSLGGGADDYLTHRISEDMPQPTLVLRVGTAFRWQLELHCEAGITQGGTDDFSLIQRMLTPIAQLQIIYSCGVGDRNMADLPDYLLSLQRSAEDGISVLMHDYLPISPSYTLLNHAGRYDGVPNTETDDPAHRHSGPKGANLTLADWQTNWGKLIAQADEITVFSQNSAKIFAQAYPTARHKICVNPHQLLISLPRLPTLPTTHHRVVGVLGNIGFHKGAGILQTLSHMQKAIGAVNLVILGRVDPMFPLGPSAHIHGGYKRADIAALVSRFGITDWLIPSIWPETFSYTTHEALATGLPVWAFDLGAQADAIRNNGKGGLIAIPDGIPDLDALFAALTRGRFQPESSAA